MLTIEAQIQIDFTPPDEKEAVSLFERLGFKQIFQEAIKESLDSKLGEVNDFKLSLN